MTGERFMTEPKASLSELVEVLNDGIALFGQAIEHSRNPQHIELFERVRRLKQIIAADLKAEIALHGGEPTSEGSWLGSIRQSYAELRARLARDPEHSYVVALEEQEDRVLKAFRDAATEGDRGRVSELANTYLSEIQEMHDRLRSLKRSETVAAS
jgi:uncharacterized protein (TIGR02284 family)